MESLLYVVDLKYASRYLQLGVLYLHFWKLFFGFFIYF